MFRVVQGVTGDIVIRGGEGFTNIMEFNIAHDYDNDGYLNSTDPSDPDTDGDGMSDGWEIAFGEGFLNTSLDPPVWQWVYHIDPTWAGDAKLDLDGDSMMFEDERRGHNLDEFLYGSDPTRPDTDRDSFDVNCDGYTPDDRNAIDTVEIFMYNSNPNHWDTDGDKMSDGWEIWFGLDPTDASDRLSDPDNDLLINIDEFLLGTHPRMEDSDSDGMIDGWEVDYDLDPRDPNDSDYDPDEDGFTNLTEFENGTDPTDENSHP
jgi:hypothetical protein